jgi:hypothetical protein
MSREQSRGELDQRTDIYVRSDSDLLLGRRSADGVTPWMP